MGMCMCIMMGMGMRNIAMGESVIAPPPTMLRMVPPPHKGEGNGGAGGPSVGIPSPLWGGGTAEGGGWGLESRDV